MKLLTTAGAGVGFMLIGLGIGYEYGYRKGLRTNQDAVIDLINSTDELIDSIHARDEIEEEAPVVEPDEKPKSEKEILETGDLKEEEYTPYFKPEDVESEKKWDKSEDFDLISVTFAEDEDEGEEETPEEAEARALAEAEAENLAYFGDDSKPYTIEPDVFRENETGYEQDSWTYHSHDGYVVDFSNQVLSEEDVEEYLGDTVKQLENAHDDSMIYVRAPARQTEIELILDTRPFDEVYGGKRERLQRKAAKQRRLMQDESEA